MAQRHQPNGPLGPRTRRSTLTGCPVQLHEICHDLKHAGYSLREISEATGYSKTHVARILAAGAAA